MKTIGLLGGTSWTSTILYYNYLNQEISKKLGGHHSARIILYSIDYHDIKSLYEKPHSWDKISQLLQKELTHLSDMKPDCILVCNNTLHKALPTLNTDVPIVSIVDSTGAYLAAEKLKKVLFVGTKFTMEDGFYSKRLEENFSLNVSIPNVDDRVAIQKIQSRVSKGDYSSEDTTRFMAILNRYKEYDAIVLACTELPLVVDENLTQIRLINTINIQCEAGLKLLDI